MRLPFAVLALTLTAPALAAEDRMQRAEGSFTVAVAPQPAEAGMGRFGLSKSFSGDLAGSSQGVMLSAGDPGKGEAGYVAIETVTGTLGGRSGGFALQHSGTMSGGKQELAISVVPGSGSGALAGITGTMTIRISGGVHHYVLTYALPAPP